MSSFKNIQILNRETPRPELQSQVITFLRFPLIVLLVFFHSSGIGVQIGSLVFEGNSTDMPLYHYCTLIFSGPFAFRNQFFFFVSGFLFFSSIKQLDLSIYKIKLRNRVNSLLVPYLFWNFAIFVLYFAMQNIPQLSMFTNKDIHLHDFFSYFWNNGGAMKDDYLIEATVKNMPLAYQFWFVRDLMVAALMSPFIYFYCKKTKIYGILLLGILWSFNWWISIPGFNILWGFFFTAGAYFGINKRNLIEDFGKLRNISFVLFPILSITYCFIGEEIFFEKYHVLHAIMNLTGIVFSFNLIAYLFDKGTIKSVPKFLAAATFFIFATHDLFIKFFRKLSYLIVRPETDLANTVLYFADVILVILFALGLYYLLRRFLPKFTRVITGGR